MKIVIRFFLAIVLLLLAGFPSTAAAEALAAGESAALIPECGCGVAGFVLDGESGEPLGWVDVLIEETRYAEASHSDGSFHLSRLSPGTWTIRAMRIGYRDVLRKVTVVEGDTVGLMIHMTRANLALQEVEFRVKKAEGSFLHDPVQEFNARELERELGLTVAESVDEEPGIAQRSMGPAPARPVLRGLGGDRLLILEDGGKSGDLSASSSDHAVAVDPMTAKRIQVIRGPEAFIYGPGVLGGVINVERGSIPQNLPEKFTGAATLGGETVNSARGVGGNVEFPLGPLGFRVDGSLRQSSDVGTPEGSLDNTSTETVNGSGGLSWVSGYGSLGFSASTFDSEYGIPGGFVGAHPNGVDISMQRQGYKSKSRLFINSKSVRFLELDASWLRYHHAEYESSGSLGMEFGVVTKELDARFHLGNQGPFSRGVLGVWFENRNYKTGGLTFTPNSVEQSLALYLFEERVLGRWKVQGSIRGDAKTVRPDEERTSIVVGEIRNREFSGFSGSFMIERQMNPGWSVGSVLIRSWRAPMLEELYSEGPHLAAYSYEVGNPTLVPEYGTGLELYTRFRKTRAETRISLFTNLFDTYIFPQNTGEYSARRADLYLYEYRGEAVKMGGAELYLWLKLSPHWDVNLSSSYVMGILADGGENLPMIPPLFGSLGFDHTLGNWTLTVDFAGAASQKNVGEFESPTSAWLRVDLGVQFQFVIWGFLHTGAATVENVGDVSYRKHLSRVKDILPEPGRNLRILYRIHF